MNDFDFIVGLGNQHFEQLGFIPATAIANQYIANGRYVIQKRRGDSVGYILHGKPSAGGILTIAQHCIEYDFRDRGYGRTALDVVIDRAKQANCRAIKATVAEDLECHPFWQAYGFEITRVLSPDNARNRQKMVYIFDLWPRLF